MTKARIGAFKPSSMRICAVRGQARQAALEQALARKLGHDRAATFLRNVLDETERHEVPTDVAAYEAFVHDELTPRLMPLLPLHELGELLRGALHRGESIAHPTTGGLGGLRQAATERSRVVAVDFDHLRARELGRALARGGADVELLDDAGQLGSKHPFDVVVLRVDDHAERAIEALARRGTRAGLITFDESHARAAIRRAACVWPNDRFVVVPADASVDVVATRVRMAIDEARPRPRPRGSRRVGA